LSIAAATAATAAEAGILLKADRAYTLICTEAYFDLEEWNAPAAASAAAEKVSGYNDAPNDGSNSSNNSSGGGNGGVDASARDAALVLHGDWARSVRNAAGGLCSARATLRQLQRAQKQLARARSQRNVALVQPAAWVEARMAAMATPTATATTAAATTTNNNNHDSNADDAQMHAPLLPSPPATDAAAEEAAEEATAASTATTPSTLATATTTSAAAAAAAERARLTAVLGELVRDDRQRRSHDVWRRECAAGRHLKALVARFGAGVVLVNEQLWQGE
jgi:hypothetical protein